MCSQTWRPPRFRYCHYYTGNSCSISDWSFRHNCSAEQCSSGWHCPYYNRTHSNGYNCFCIFRKYLQSNRGLSSSHYDSYSTNSFGNSSNDNHRASDLSPNYVGLKHRSGYSSSASDSCRYYDFTTSTSSSSPTNSTGPDYSSDYYDSISDWATKYLRPLYFRGGNDH